MHAVHMRWRRASPAFVCRCVPASLEEGHCGGGADASRAWAGRLSAQSARRHLCQAQAIVSKGTHQS